MTASAYTEAMWEPHLKGRPMTTENVQIAADALTAEVPEYPYHDKTIKITRCGRIYIRQRKINLSTVFAGQYVGIREVSDKIWLVSFMDYDLGFFDEEVGRVEPAENPFVPKLLPMSSV